MAARKYNNPATFDTLSYAKRLQAAGFTQEQAEVQAETFLAIVQEQLVSKRDLKELEVKIEDINKELVMKIENARKELVVKIENLRKELVVKIENVRKELKVEMELLRRDLKIWFGSMLVVTVTILSGMMALIVHLGR